MLDNAVYGEISGKVSAADFSSEMHRSIFRQIETLIGNGLPADVVSVFEALREVPLEYIGTIASNTPSAGRVKHYADLLKMK